MSTFVLVPGAWLGAWAWEDVSTRLTAAGHGAVPVTLPGLAERAGEQPAATIGLTTHVDDVVARIVADDLHDVVLVVHSYAGTLGGPVADRVPERLARVVYLATRPVPDGLRLLDLMGPEAEQIIRDLAVAAGDPDRVPPPDLDILGRYYPRHGMEGDVLEHFLARATGHPMATQSEKVTRTGAGDAVPRTLVWCAGDGPVPIRTDEPGWTVTEIPTGHWPMLTHPDLLTGVLCDLARTARAR